jgi:hypothetical protein
MKLIVVGVALYLLWLWRHTVRCREFRRDLDRRLARIDREYYEMVGGRPPEGPR